MSWLGDARFLAGADVRHLLRGKETIVWTFVMPIVFFFFIGSVTSGMGGSGNAGPVTIAVQAPVDAGFLCDRLLARLTDNDFAVVRVADIEASAHRRQLVIPAGFTAAVLAGDEVVVRLRHAGSGSSRDYDKVRVQRAVYTTLADVVASSERGTPSPETMAGLDAMPRTMTLRVEPAGERQVIPHGYEQTIPGIMVMFTLITLLTSGAVLLVIERNQGLLRRLAATPMSRGAIVAGKWGGKMALGIVQISFAMVAGTLLFGMEWGTALPMIVLVMFAWGGFCASLGLLLGVLVRTEGQAVGIGVLVTNVLAALGGCWWPIEITPPWMQSLAIFLPTGWAMDAMHRLISFQAGAASVLPHLAVLVFGAVVLGWIGARRFRFQ